MIIRGTPEFVTMSLRTMWDQSTTVIMQSGSDCLLVKSSDFPLGPITPAMADEIVAIATAEMALDLDITVDIAPSKKPPSCP